MSWVECHRASTATCCHFTVSHVQASSREACDLSVVSYHHVANVSAARCALCTAPKHYTRHGNRPNQNACVGWSSTPTAHPLKRMGGSGPHQDKQPSATHHVDICSGCCCIEKANAPRSTLSCRSCLLDLLGPSESPLPLTTKSFLIMLIRRRSAFVSRM